MCGIETVRGRPPLAPHYRSCLSSFVTEEYKRQKICIISRLESQLPLEVRLRLISTFFAKKNETTGGILQ